jgi:hypothetical protein
MSGFAHPSLPAPLRRSHPDRDRVWADRTWRRWTAAWLGGTVLAIANGVARETLYAGRGATWLALTVAFEFGFGHWVDGRSWSELAANYDVTTGHVFVVVLIWVAAGPAVVRALRRA